MAVSSADNNQSVPATPDKKNRSILNERKSKSGQWTDMLQKSDVGRLWNELHRIVSNHPLVRASRNAGLLVEEGGRYNAYTDMTQELFVTLLSKGRFQHYLDTEMTDAEIECEIAQIELTNILTAELRKRHPESYRLARRISTIIQANKNFRRFDVIEGEETHKRLAERIYGLSEWPEDKLRRPTHDLEERIQIVPVRQRDTRVVGCTGDAQIIISNADLENLIISVLDAADSPIDMRTLRSLVMSRLPVMDIYLVPLGGTSDNDDENWNYFEPADQGDTPEQGLLKQESEDEAANYVSNFLKLIQDSVRGKSKQYDRILGVLWYCYLSPDQITQLEAAARLNVSDSLVSDYRRRIEQQLRSLSFTSVEQARRFETALREKVQTLVTVEDESVSV
jgi:hypothetical protein